MNKLAPHARDAKWGELVEAHYGPDVLVTEVHVNSFEGVRAAARGAAAWQTDLVIAVGGDGTVNACVNGIEHAPTRIGVFPAGTANDLAREVGQRLHTVSESIGMKDWTYRDLDAISVNDSQFYSVGGLGWVCDVAAKANHWRAHNFLARKVLSRLGSLIYNIACIMVILFSRTIGSVYKVRYVDAIDGETKTLEFDGYGVLVANFGRIGKSFRLADQSDSSDGVFELLLVPRKGRLQLLRTVLAATRGMPLDETPDIRVLQVQSAQIQCDKAAFFGDGEILREGEHFFNLELAREPLRLMAPRALAEEIASETEQLAMETALLAF